MRNKKAGTLPTVSIAEAAMNLTPNQLNVRHTSSVKDCRQVRRMSRNLWYSTIAEWMWFILLEAWMKKTMILSLLVFKRKLNRKKNSLETLVIFSQSDMSQV